MPGKGWNTILRLYNPLESFFDSIETTRRAMTDTALWAHPYFEQSQVEALVARRRSALAR